MKQHYKVSKIVRLSGKTRTVTGQYTYHSNLRDALEFGDYMYGLKGKNYIVVLEDKV